VAFALQTPAFVGRGPYSDGRGSGTLFDVSVQARSIRQAVGIVVARYPGADVRVSFPIDGEVFFVEEPGSRAARLRREWPERVAA
jgi:hypothetical protein